MAFGWQGEKTRLVPLDKALHFENMLAWINDAELTDAVLMGDLPTSREAEEAWFAQRAEPGANPDRISFAIETLDGEHIGTMSLMALDWRQGVAYGGTMIGRRDLWGRGYATDAIRVRTRWAFETLGLRMLLTEVYADNLAIQRALGKSGYREVGRIPNRTWKRGRFRDVVIMMVDREGWAELGGAVRR